MVAAGKWIVKLTGMLGVHVDAGAPPTTGTGALAGTGDFDCCCTPPDPCEAYPGSLTTYADLFGGDLSGWTDVPASLWTTSGGNLVIEKFGGSTGLRNYFKCATGNLDDVEIDIEADMQTADAPNSGDNFHDAYVGIFGAAGWLCGIRIQNRLNGELDHEYRFASVLGATVTALTTYAAAPGSALCRILVETTSPSNWQVKFYVGGTLLETTAIPDLDTKLTVPCEFAIGYIGSTQVLLDTLDPPAAGFISFRSTSFAATVTCV